MDQKNRDIGWWLRVALDGWRDLPGPRYRRLAAALTAAVERRLIAAGDRLPAERPLADALSVSRGTVVRCFDELAASGVVERIQGSGTFVRARPSWTGALPGHGAGENPASALLRRRHAGESGTIDLSLSVPAGTDHLPPLGALDPLAEAEGHGLHPAGTAELRTALADHLTHRLRLPTTAEQLIVTSGTRHALALLAAAAVPPGRTVVAACPYGGGLPGTLAGRGARVVGVPADAWGIDASAAHRAASRLSAPVLHVDSAALGASRREALLHTARRTGALVVEDLAQAGLYLGPGDGPAPPLAAADDGVVAVGSLSRTLWAGLRVGWIRAPEALRDELLHVRPAHEPAPGVPSQVWAARLLRAVDDAWLERLRQALRARRDLLLALLARHLPAWRPEPSVAGLSLWAALPVTDSETYAHLATRYGVVVAPGAAHCVCGRHRAGVRLSIAEAPHRLEAAVDRLAAAWEHHARDLAATP
ncbi:PLP-dependent aminotransferase family protein [Streptomyces sp. UNOC14_S4]|uniref:aminotransferase-like domain-containing protein n=1 Tax=Streptomyces sp. UNOC14_S4 TaxID=2872340 RepID=UPI001E4082D1|nr:PLP-dependent aminotransferase family protein [Streptomyces sp. UNOC14_S4]MCC3768759.1 PLP-dependent aminotransferase family protein [Streptomyces sp. UNOC14_S4]